MRFHLCRRGSITPPPSYWPTAASRRSPTRTRTPRLSSTPLHTPAQVALKIKSFTCQKETRTQRLSLGSPLSLFHQIFHHYPPNNPPPHSSSRWSSFEVSLSSAHPHPAITSDTALLSRVTSSTSSTSSSPPLHPLPLQLSSSELGENEGGGDLGPLYPPSACSTFIRSWGNLWGKVAHLS